MTTVACAQGRSSERDKCIKYFFFLIFLLKKFAVLPLRFIEGFPNLSFNISISLKLIPFLIPVPSALLKASFAAYLFA